MRYQERIYIQNNNSAVRNKDIVIVNMSSDICVFQQPLYNLSGATKLNCSGGTGTTGTSYVVSTATTIPLTFVFTGNTSSFSSGGLFKYEIYKYNPPAEAFLIPPVYQSSTIQYSALTGTSATTQSIPISGLSLDGEYLVKGYDVFSACTNFLNLLGKTVDTLTYRSGTSYGLYDPNLDYYFIAIAAANTPMFAQGASNTQTQNSLTQQIFLPSNGQTVLTLSSTINGAFLLTLNGLILAPKLDYTFTGNIVTLSASTVSGDIITAIYTTGGGNNLTGDNIQITTPIASGTTNNQGNNLAYFNTGGGGGGAGGVIQGSTGKFEIYTTVTPSLNQQILVMINGVTLANGIDYYQSITNPKRIILQGNLLIGDIITIAYYPSTNVVNGLTINNPTVNWTISTAPQATNGYFLLEVSQNSVFSTIYYSATTPYVVGQTAYNSSFIVTGSTGTNYYYKVANIKNYETICGDIITTTATSETIPIVIQTNSINSY